MFGDRAWWLYLAVPVYSVYLAWTTFFGMKKGLASLGGAGGSEDVSNGGSSKRQQKLEKRGGQRVQYR